MSTQDVARDYIAAGWAVVPLVRGEKRAASSWNKLTYGPDDFGPTDGIAGKCGSPSGWRVDVDCDAPEAVEAAKLLMPHTGLIHGRPGKPDSHYWYRCEGAKTVQYVGPGQGKREMIIELRSDGGYTALPPSMHPSGEALAWATERDPTDIDHAPLGEAVKMTAVAALLARYWPGSGARHQMIGPLAGFLYSAKLEPLVIVQVITAAMRVAGDRDEVDRLAFVRSTLEKAKRGEPVTGGPKLAECLGDPVVTKLRTWLRVADLDAFERMNQKHFIVRIGKDEVIATEEDDEVIFQHKRALELRYANKRVTVGEDKAGKPVRKPLFTEWVGSNERREHRTVVFAPPPLDQFINPRDYNLWRGFAVEPKAGDCDRLLHHLHEVVCSANDEHSKYLCKLLAFTAQHPGIPSEVATVLRGEPGTGKGIFVRALAALFGRHAAHVDKVDQLVGHFNAAMSAKVLVFADEAFWAGDKREAGALKRLITEPSLMIERKGLDPVPERNCTHLFIATNSEWSVPAMLRERRFFALNVSNVHQGDFKYFEALQKELNEGGLAAFLDLLLNLPVTHEEIRQVPKTEELRVQQAQSLSTELEWWQECLYQGKLSDQVAWPTGWLPVVSAHVIYRSWAQDHGRRALTLIEFSRRMGEYLWQVGTNARKLVKISGDVVRCGQLLSLEDARATFDRKLGNTSYDWPDVKTDPNDPTKLAF